MLRIAAPVHFAVPYRNAGSEIVLHLMLKALAAAGHQVGCWATDIPRAPRRSSYEGVEIRSFRNIKEVYRDLKVWKPDVVISHHQHAEPMIRSFPRTVYLTHNDMWVNKAPLMSKPSLVIHNSEWVAESLKSRYGSPNREMVMHPPLDCERHQVGTTGDAVTMVNINAHKGSSVLIHLARAFPEHQFLAVMGGHGRQEINKVRRIPNVEVVPHTADLRPVWERTGVIIMPSIYESFGLVPAEAGCSGIPSLTTPTPGLIESRGDAGIHIERDDLKGWERELDRLYSDPDHYRQASKASRERSAFLAKETEMNLERVVNEVESL